MTILNAAAAGIVLFHGLFFALNNMCRKTDIRMRITWVLLTAGAGAVLLLEHAPAWPTVVFHCGIAAMVCCDRRNSLFNRRSSCN